MHNRVGLGTFPLAGVFNPIDRDEAVNLVREYINLGGYYIDTAPLYGNGEVEKILGDALRGIPRDSYYLVTKTVKHVDENGQQFKSGKAQDVIRQIDNSLFRLSLDYVDVLMVHSPDPDVPIDETLGAMERLQSMGKVRELAVSNVDLTELKEYNQTRKIKFIQNRFSLINRSISQEMQDYMHQHKVKLIPYQVIDRGQLTGKVFEGVGKMREGDLRIGRSDWMPEKVEVISDWVRDSLNPIASRLGITLGQLSISWALHQPYMGFVIVGATNPEFIGINLKADKIKLSSDDLVEIDSAYLQLEAAVKSRFGVSLREFRGLNEKYY